MSAGTSPLDEQSIRMAVRERYARAAVAGTSRCETATHEAVQGSCCDASSCGDAPLTFHDGRPIPDELAGASLGCGAPIEAAALRPGETVVDLGSGAGLDVFMAASRVGPMGRAIGVDMTPEMIAKARTNAARLGATNVEFLLGEIEHLPVADGTADVVISNCVINLLPDKRRAFAEAFRVLRQNGRLVVSDIVSAQPLPDSFKTAEHWTACLAGAIPEQDYLDAIARAGFSDVQVLSKQTYAEAPASTPLYSTTIRAVKSAST